MSRTPRDFREFVFTATGGDTDLEEFSVIDAYDNATSELEKLHALGELLEVGGGEMDPEALGGIALLVKDIRKRLAAIMEAVVHSHRRQPSTASSSPEPTEERSRRRR